MMYWWMVPAVALFSLLAATPTLLVVIFASLLFQFGVDFWFSDRSRGMFENAAGLAEGYYQENQRQVGANTFAMAGDLGKALTQLPIDSSRLRLKTGAYVTGSHRLRNRRSNST